MVGMTVGISMRDGAESRLRVVTRLSGRGAPEVLPSCSAMLGKREDALDDLGRVGGV